MMASPDETFPNRSSIFCRSLISRSRAALLSASNATRSCSTSHKTFGKVFPTTCPRQMPGHVCQHAAVRVCGKQYNASPTTSLLLSKENKKMHQTPFTPIFLCLTAYTCEIAYLSSVNQEISNHVRLVDLRWKIVALDTSSHLMPIGA